MRQIGTSQQGGTTPRPKRQIDELAKLDPLPEQEQRIDPSNLSAIQARSNEAIANLERAIVNRVAEPSSNALPPTSSPTSATEVLLGMPAEGRSRSLKEQLNDALHQLVAEDSSVLFFGEDIADPYGGAFKISDGLTTKHGDQAFSTPISEAAIAGMAGGLALGGLKPIVEIMFGDFLTLAADALINQLAKYRGMYGNRVNVPVLVRTPMGGRRGYGPTHSQSLEKHFVGVPGLRVYAVSPYHPVHRILSTALNSVDPALLIENKIDYGVRPERTPDGKLGDFSVRYVTIDDCICFQASITGFEDDEIDLLTYGGTTKLALDAAERLMIEQEISVRVSSVSRLSPLPKDLLDEILDDRPVILLEEGPAEYGIVDGVAAWIAENKRGQAICRISGRLSVIPSSRDMEADVLPTIDEVCAMGIELASAR